MDKLHNLSVRELRGVGPRREEELQKLSITTVADLIEYFPYRYEDFRVRHLASAADGDKVTVKGTVHGMPNVRHYGRRKSRMSCRFLIDGVSVNAVWFNQTFLRERLQLGEQALLTGKWDARRKQLTVAQCEFGDSEQSRANTLQPVYSVGGSITQRWIRTTISQAMKQFGHMIDEQLPVKLLKKHALMPRKEAIMHVHHPTDISLSMEARKRIVYEELFLFQLKLQAFRAMRRNKKDGIERKIDNHKIRKFVRSLPFELTDSQKRVVLEITDDLGASSAMNRLLQGDVGSGKTIVAAIALYANYLSGHQGVLMVPTEILAEQHLESLQQLFAPLGLELGLLTGSLKVKQRRDLKAAMQMGIVDIVIGTHALIQDDVIFRKLGLVITDEQHRFGVDQRSILRSKGFQPDVLTMTATPIPRTLAITAFGDLDVSSLRELPKGRKPVDTYWVRPDKMDQVIRMLRKEASRGRQSYVICPLIEESEKLDVQNAVDLHTMLSQVLPTDQVALLHGKMPATEKEAIMDRFHRGQIDVLVSTTVIEVGVNVPNATLMVIYNADRFGLSQLHQLRGRVGRGHEQSYCVLIADPKSENSIERMRVMTETQDGFEIARRDLELRGPGEFFGKRQSGLPEFRLADLVRDFVWMEQAREDAAELTAETDFWTSKWGLPLRHYLIREGILDGELLD